jgi:hypothetical protein
MSDWLIVPFGWKFKLSPAHMKGTPPLVPGVVLPLTGAQQLTPGSFVPSVLATPAI